MDTDLLHFDYLGAEKIEFEVGRPNLKIFGKWQFFQSFLGGPIF